MERKIHFWENWLIFLGTWGESELILRIWGAMEKYFQGAEEFSVRDFGRSMHYFQGRGNTDPPGASFFDYVCILKLKLNDIILQIDAV